ncbi:MAG: hypothetical protein LC723_05055, partial [Actinobacteria bacterium]|nr:hypothetical protein [Actinomycetota bacterium]
MPFDTLDNSQPLATQVGTPAPAGTPAPSDTGAPTQQVPATPNQAQPGATQPGGNEALVPSHRLRETREAYER